MIPIKIILSTEGENHFYKGFLNKDKHGKEIQYLDENMDTVNIFITDCDVEIKRINSIMKFNIQKDHEFSYCTEYGNLLFKLVTKFMLVEENYFKIEYSLYDEFDILAHNNIILLEYIKE
jgi:formyltetrahydrofolate synthetase